MYIYVCRLSTASYTVSRKWGGGGGNERKEEEKKSPSLPQLQPKGRGEKAGKAGRRGPGADALRWEDFGMILPTQQPNQRLTVLRETGFFGPNWKTLLNPIPVVLGKWPATSGSDGLRHLNLRYQGIYYTHKKPTTAHHHHHHHNGGPGFANFPRPFAGLKLITCIGRGPPSSTCIHLPLISRIGTRRAAGQSTNSPLPLLKYLGSQVVATGLIVSIQQILLVPC